MPTFSSISHDAFLAAIDTLATTLAADDWQPDHLVGIGRGGLVPGTFLSHATGVPLLTIDLSAGVADFGDALVDRLAARTADGARLLFVDDINDSGATIARLRERTVAAGAIPANIRFAVLIDNIRSTATVEYRHRRIDRSVNKDWFVFPWEAVAPQARLAADANAVPGRIA
ncbi:phosphoribosyltransferase [Sphingomonas montana]|uniref:phosphoribosyltransferase n=1 Tax=Sphingomonas montana TaxID=1843236 RepID=UPI00096C1DEF|nr:phosphoribosyltransferase family protein [Sphingomonas montana]